MLRRQARLRREYLYRKSLEGKARVEYERRVEVRKALAEGRPIPTELRSDSRSLLASDEYADASHDIPHRSIIDDEYARAGETDPRVVVTTSRDPSVRLKLFAKEIKLLFPNAQRLNRGNLIISELVKACVANEITDIIMLHETRGEPDALIVSHLPYGPTAYFNLSNVVMRHDIQDDDLGTVSEAYPHLIFDNFHSTLGQRLTNILKYLFPVPKADSKRVLTFKNDMDFISFRHHVYTKEGKRREDIVLKEVGPRFEMHLFQLRLGTIDQDHADDEWVLRPYMRSAKRRRALG